MITRFFTLFFLLTTGLLSAQNSLLRMPRISPDAQEMAFSYQGDIWVYNFNTKQTKRITIHQGYESNPVWNTSGDKIAFLLIEKDPIIFLRFKKMEEPPNK